jgi:hypothetical protein
LPYWRTVVGGEEICRLHLLAGLKVFGAPTANLFRCDLVKSSEAFFPNPRAEADISACVKHLRHSDFGFVHQVLSYERCHGDRITTASRSLDAYITSEMSDLLDYGPEYLTAPELEKRLRELLDEYYRCLAIAVVNIRDRTYWRFQKKRFDELRLRLDRIRLGRAVCAKALDLLLSPRETVNKYLRRRNGAVVQSRASVVTKK